MGNYLFKVSNQNNKIKHKRICSKLTIETLEQLLLLTFNLIHTMFYCSLKAGKCKLG